MAVQNWKGSTGVVEPNSMSSHKTASKKILNHISGSIAAQSPAEPCWAEWSCRGTPGFCCRVPSSRWGLQGFSPQWNAGGWGPLGLVCSSVEVRTPCCGAAVGSPHCCAVSSRMSFTEPGHPRAPRQRLLPSIPAQRRVGCRDGLAVMYLLQLPSLFPEEEKIDE